MIKVLRIIAVLFVNISVYSQSCRLEPEDLPLLNQWKISHSKEASQGKVIYSGKKDNNEIECVVELPEAGEYYLWGRSISYGQNYRKTRVIINGVDCGAFGDEPIEKKGGKSQFVCKRQSKPVKLPKGKIKIKLVPLSAYSRCDVIVLTKDKDFKLPNDRKEIEKINKLSVNGLLGVKKKSNRKLNVLLFHGGRPWTGTNTERILNEAGFNVRLVDSRGLDGLGGAPIRRSLRSKVEPEPEDWITPEFKKLDHYDVVIVSSIPRKLQRKFYTPERLDELKKYIEKGGVFIVTENAPYKLLEPFLPVKFSSGNLHGREKNVCCLSDSQVFSGIPEKWPCFSINDRKLSLKAGAKALVWEIDKDNNKVMPYIAVWEFGKGKVIYNNFDWGRKNWFRQMFNWAYFPLFMRQLINYAGGLSPPPILGAKGKKLPEKIKSLHLSLAPPSFSEEGDYAPAEILQDHEIVWIKFSNGSLIEFNKSTLSYNGFAPGMESPVYHNCRAPEFLKDTEQEKTFKDSEFSTAGKLILDSSHKLQYAFESIEKTDGGGVVIKLKDDAKNISLSWLFSPKNMEVQGRVYKGFGEKAIIDCPNQIFSSAVFSNQVRMGENINDHVSCRFYAYSSPRGYLETSFAEDKKSSGNRGGFFGSGQPFNWLFSNYGVVCEFFERPFCNSNCISHEKGQRNIEIRNIIKFGRLRTPLETPFVWRLFSPGRPVGKNAWLAMYQYLRLRYCRQVGIDPVMTMPEPGTSYSNTCTEEEVRKTFEAARELGFKRIYLPFCPSEIEEMLKERAGRRLKLAREYDLEAEMWTPASHVRDLSGTAAEKHPEWLVYAKDGKPFAYGGQFKVYDLNNKKCYENYLNILDEGVSRGLKQVWFDMGAALMELPVNYKTDTSKVMLDKVIEVYKHLNKQGVRVRIEGISPFAVDGFWFRKSKYPDVDGNEFAFVGTGCYADMKDNMSVDYFRMGMHNAFCDFSSSPYACGMENVPGELEAAEEIGKLNPVFYKAIEATGNLPFVQQTCFGTSWTSDKGAALFFWNPVENLVLDLPENWEIKEAFSLSKKPEIMKGNILKNITHKSIVLIGQK